MNPVSYNSDQPANYVHWFKVTQMLWEYPTTFWLDLKPTLCDRSDTAHEAKNLRLGNDVTSPFLWTTWILYNQYTKHMYLQIMILYDNCVWRFDSVLIVGNTIYSAGVTHRVW